MPPLLRIAVLIALPIAAAAQEAVHGVEVLLPPSYHASHGPSAERQHASEVTLSPEVSDDSRDATPLIVFTAASPPVPGWEGAAEIEIVRLDHEVVVVSVPEPMPGWRKLQGVDIRYHGIPEAGGATRIRTHSWQPETRAQIPEHDWRSADAARIPYARSGSALAAQSWNASGARYRASRIRYHGWGGT
jgi:hypothetical protein